ncbi:MAG: arginyl-tRNA synthetase [Bacteroides sp. SM1_62]|nr:MAG: arginyl-tRNA synthetase [Bacteroides sp. SM23_62]KPL25810.1 MAG: arginyl-tRNA synthetase [Bacteroides sp. SM1_62]
MDIYQIILQAVQRYTRVTYDVDLDIDSLQIQKTRKEFEGDLTLVVFPLLRITGKSPEESGEEIGAALVDTCTEIEGYNVIKGFLNLTVSRSFWLQKLLDIEADGDHGKRGVPENAPVYVVEYSSPNTNKPLHLGHIRNNLIGYSISSILEANGCKVQKVNLVNDRGIHICKSMLAWQKWGQGETPETAGMKGDHLVGDYYVRFDKEYKSQVKELAGKGMPLEQAQREAPLIREAQEMLRQWEARDPSVTALWKQMNGWVYEGFDRTYDRLGVSFDRIYYESDTYTLGKSIVTVGLEKGILYKKEDGSVWADLTDEGLDQKLLLRSDGTSVYMTQDLGTAHQRFAEFNFDTHVYVVGNEQDYHFQVLALILKKLGYAWAERLVHLSYGMVELPGGKMKSREGTVVDADDLMDEMTETARSMSAELGKLDGYSEDEKNDIFTTIGLGALKYFILKVDPRKNMTFDPVESVDFNGNTGPFIQYTHARIRSVLKKAAENGLEPGIVQILDPNPKETDLIKRIYFFPEVVSDAGHDLNPAVIANYCYELAKEFNQFYHDYSIVNAESEGSRRFRLLLSGVVVRTIATGMQLLGIEMPERM